MSMKGLSFALAIVAAPFQVAVTPVKATPTSLNIEFVFGEAIAETFSVIHSDPVALFVAGSETTSEPGLLHHQQHLSRRSVVIIGIGVHDQTPNQFSHHFSGYV